MELKRILAAACLVAAFGCETEYDDDDYGVDRDADDTGTMTDRAVPPATPDRTTAPPAQSPTGAGQVTEDARRFVTEAYSGNMFEIQSAQLAMSKSLDQPMQQVAQTILNDHQRALDELRQIVRNKGITAQEQLQPKHQQMLDQLRNLSGADFQQQFRQMQLQAHQEAISLYQQAAQTLQDQELKTYAQQTLPTLQSHLQHIQQVQPGAAPGAEEVDDTQPPATPPGVTPG